MMNDDCMNKIISIDIPNREMRGKKKAKFEN